MLNRKIDVAVPQRQQVIGYAGVYGGIGQVKNFLKVTTKVGERTDSGKLFQELNDLFSIGLDSRDRQSDSFIGLSECDGSGVASKEHR